MVQARTLAALAALSFVQVYSLDLNVDSTDSIKTAASTIANGMVSFYSGNETGNVPGLLPSPYYWYQGGMLFDTLIRYWHLSGDSQYNSLVSQGIQFQQGPNSDFMPPNQTKSEGNDDQGVWALAAMSAAESEFPEAENGTLWIALAEAVFNDQVLRWDSATCGGGLRWQIFTFNTGYNYKNSLANGEFFQLASRLARYTGNSTYSDWAAKAFQWSTDVGLIDDQWNVFDGASTTQNCSSVDKIQFSINAGAYISGAAHMYNISATAEWKTALDGLLNQTLATFFPSGVLTEVSCETHDTCTSDMEAYKGILANALVDTIQMAPYTSQSILTALTSSAQAAAKACNGAVCPEAWSGTSTNDTSSLGDQLSALGVVQALLVKDVAAPVHGSNATSTSSGTSTVSPTSGTSTSGTPTSGTPAAGSTNAAVAVGGEGAKFGVLAAGLGGMALVML